MITKKRFFEIKNEVESAVVQLFDYVFSRNSNYILILADAEYKPQYIGKGLSPYVISDKVDYYKEATRLAFSQYFLNNHYTFGAGVEQTTDTPEKLYIEMMVYCHIWESNKFLKQLYRMQQLACGGIFPWEADEMPDSSKQGFILKTIRDGFKEVGLDVAQIITKGFKTSLRNSFLHGEFDMDKTNKRIRLHTYRSPRKLQYFELDEITYDEWTEYYMYSAFMNYCFILEKEKRRKTVKTDFNTDEFQIVHPISRTAWRILKIYYDESRTDFSFYKSTTPYIRPKTSKIETQLIDEASRVSPVISKEELEAWEQDVAPSISEVLDQMHIKSPNEYIAFLFDVSWDTEKKVFMPGQSLESLRFEFAGKYVAAFYYNTNAINPIPELIQVQLEMLIYCHIWESKLFLKQLRIAIQVLEQTKVEWHYNFPDDRRLFVDDLIERYKAQNLKLGSFIEFAFHTSLRNAFAHSEYDIQMVDRKIYLDTYKPSEPWDISQINIEEWACKFIVSLMMDFHFFIEKEKRRNTISQAELEQTIAWMNKNLKKP